MEHSATTHVRKRCDRLDACLHVGTAATDCGCSLMRTDHFGSAHACTQAEGEHDQLNEPSLELAEQEVSVTRSALAEHPACVCAPGLIASACTRLCRITVAWMPQSFQCSTGPKIQWCP